MIILLQSPLLDRLACVSIKGNWYTRGHPWDLTRHGIGKEICDYAT
jgi:hypothetical protein